MHKRREAYAFPGGYPIYYITKDCGILCPTCANEKESLEADENDPQWFVVGKEINYERTDYYCDHCNKRIESAYATENEHDIERLKEA